MSEKMFKRSRVLTAQEVESAGAFTSLPVRQHFRNDICDNASRRCLEDWANFMDNGELKPHHVSQSPQGSFCSFVYSECMEERLECVSYLTDLFFLIDDATEEVESSEEAMQQWNSFSEAMTQSVTDQGLSRMDKLQLGKKKMASQCMLDFLRLDPVLGMDLVNAARTQWSPESVPPSEWKNMEDFFRHRHLNAGIATFWAEIAFGLGDKITPEEEESIHDMVWPCEKAAMLQNDYWGWEKESAEAFERGTGIITNSIATLMSLHSISAEQAKQKAREMVFSNEAEYLRAKKQYYRDHPNMRPFLKMWIEQVGCMASGVAMWSACAPRYYHPDRPDCKARALRGLTGVPKSSAMNSKFEAPPSPPSSVDFKLHKEVIGPKGDIPPELSLSDITIPGIVSQNEPTKSANNITSAFASIYAAICVILACIFSPVTKFLSLARLYIGAAGAVMEILELDRQLMASKAAKKAAGLQSKAVGGTQALAGVKIAERATNEITVRRADVSAQDDETTVRNSSMSTLTESTKISSEYCPTVAKKERTMDSASYTYPKISSHALDSPIKYIESLPGKGVRGSLMDAFNQWLCVPSASVNLVKDVIGKLHNSSLILDDIQDSSPLRRGKPAAHIIYGMPASINSANFMYVTVVNQIHQLGIPALMTVMLEQLEELYLGQSWDLYWKHNMICPTETQYMHMVDAKTGGLFLMLIRMMHALSPSASSNSGNKISSFEFDVLAKMVGRFFQVRDDYMNLASSDLHKQKGFCEDFDEAKFSYPIVHCLQTNPSCGDTILGLFRQRRDVVDVVASPMSMECKLLILECLTKTGTMDHIWKLLVSLEEDIESEIARLERLTGESNPLMYLLLKNLSVRGVKYEGR